MTSIILALLFVFLVLVACWRADKDDESSAFVSMAALLVFFMLMDALKV